VDAAVEGLENVLVPSVFTAAIWNSYDEALVSPVTVIDVAVEAV
jgi:hypothetical protein